MKNEISGFLAVVVGWGGGGVHASRGWGSLENVAPNIDIWPLFDTQKVFHFVSSVRSSYSHPDLLVIHHPTPLFQITPVFNTGLSLSEPLQLYKGYNAI